MKNKKLFAILTLVCFLFTLMPFAAFAGDNTVLPTNNIGVPSAITAPGANNGTVKVDVTVTPENTTRSVYLYAHSSPAKQVGKTELAANAGVATFYVEPSLLKSTDMFGAVVTPLNGAPTSSEINTVGEQAIDPAKTFSGSGAAATLAGNALGATVPDASFIYTDDTDAVETLTNGTATVKIDLDLRKANNNPVYAVGSSVPVLIWVTESGSNVPSSALQSVTQGTKVVTHLQTANTANSYVYSLDADASQSISLEFVRSGKYTIHAAIDDAVSPTGTAAGLITAAGNDTIATRVGKISTKLQNNVDKQNTITINGTNTSATKYTLEIMDATADSNLTIGSTVGHAGTFTNTLTVKANNVATETIKFRLNDADGIPVKGANVKIEANSANVTLSDATLTTNAMGQFELSVGGRLEGDYKIYITSGTFTCTLNVRIGSTTPAYITVVKEPTAPIDRDNQDFSKKIRFAVTDINGNSVNVNNIVNASPNAASAGTSDMGQYAFVVNPTDKAVPYVSIVSQPSASTLKNKDVYLIEDTKANGGNDGRYATLYFNGPVTAEGVYEIKVALDNGNYATVKFEVKEFSTPVNINLTYAAPSVELGGIVYVDTLEYVDANGVTKDCTNYVNLAATGYAIDTFDSDGTAVGILSKGAVKVKSDEKYVGNTITVTAVDERYNLTTSVDLTVADAASGLSFSTKTGQVNVNNQITVMLVDSNGNRVALSGAGYGVDSISYVILEKPEGALVSASTAGVDNNLLTAGSFKMNLTSNKIGNVKVQVVAKITNRLGSSGTGSNQNVTKYYTGTQTFAIGTGETGNVVVMSIGSNEIIVNDAVKTIDAQPVVQNNRTFVPFRALAEAFGATVAYDEATQAVTAELNGVTVVLTVGSPTYTVNGEEKTMDVAPYISGSRTMVPVRFVAEAFGIKVTPTYDENGATADILFNL